MMTIPQLREHVGRQIGLPATFDGSVAAYRELSPAQQIALTQGMIAYIKSNPGSFTPAQVETATVESSRAATMTPEDDGFDADLFFDELGTEAKRVVFDPLAKVGEGVSKSFSLVGTLLPVLAVIAVGIFLYPHLIRAKNST
jgi:hypothetical protein